LAVKNHRVSKAKRANEGGTWGRYQISYSDKMITKILEKELVGRGGRQIIRARCAISCKPGGKKKKVIRSSAGRGKKKKLICQVIETKKRTTAWAIPLCRRKSF